MRFGAGIKGKIGQSLEYSLPVITTEIGAEGFDFFEFKSNIVGINSIDISNKIIQLYDNEHLWSSISTNAYKSIEVFSAEVIEQRLMDLLQ